MVGASGAVYAILTAYAIKFPNNRLIIFPIPVPVKAVYVVIGFVFFSFFAGIVDVFSGIAHFGHLGGILFGALIMFYWKRSGKRPAGMDGYEWVWEGWR
jgi:membrane associated rhomboid family serine protease